MRQANRWGVDSAQVVTEDLYDCVLTNYGFPYYWGRYIKEIPDVSEGITQSEIELLHENGTKIMPIYNAMTTAMGHREGSVAATNAAFLAKRIGVPEGTVLFGNIEYYFPVDDAWIQGWVETLYSSGYRSGLYASPERGDFATAYCEAVRENQEISNQLIIWGQDPLLEPTTADEAPSFKPDTPPCRANVWVWQYGKGAEACPIDTNLAEPRLLEQLW